MAQDGDCQNGRDYGLGRREAKSSNILVAQFAGRVLLGAAKDK
jgi:hypothetical protein